MIELELVAAAIRRCEAVVRNLPSDEYDLEEILAKLIDREAALQKYVDEAGGNAQLAFAAAKGDVAYLRHLRSSGWLRWSRRDIITKSVLPLFLIIVTAFLGNWVGNALQAKSFKRSRSFEVNLERLREGQRISTNLYSSVRLIHIRIQRDEERGELTWQPHEALLPLRNDLEQIRTVVGDFDDDRQISKAIGSAARQLDTYIICLRDRGITAGTERCSDGYSPESIIQIQDAFSRALIHYLDQAS